MTNSQRARTLAKYVISIAAVGVLGFFSARQVAAYLGERKVEQARLEAQHYRREFTQGVLMSMNTLQVGNVLPDYQFEDLAHNPLTLSGLASENTLLIFFDPACDGCDNELAAINKAIADTLDYRRFRLISSGDSGMVAEKIERFDLRIPLLYDPSADFFFQTGVLTYPFNMIVNQDGVIQDMIAGSLDRRDLVQFIEEGQLE